MQRILLVENDAEQRVQCEEAFRAVGFDVIQADNLGDAVRILNDERPEMVVVDPHWPESEELRTLQQIREDVPLVIYCPNGFYVDGFRSWLGNENVVASDDPASLSDVVRRILKHQDSSVPGEGSPLPQKASRLKVAAAMCAITGIALGLLGNWQRGRIGQWISSIRQRFDRNPGEESGKSNLEASTPERARPNTTGRPRPAEMRHMRGWLAGSQQAAELSASMALLRRFRRHRR